MRQIVLDTETTGLNPKKGDRIVEVGCVEMIDRKLTGKHYHVFINPERDIPDEVVAVHGITNEKVKDSPKFRDIAEELWVFLEGAELVIHNAAFDMGFLNAEYQLFAKEQGEPFQKLESVCSVLDTLKVAREKHPGSKVSLDALCKRYDIDNSHRTLHGALLDSEILADVYLMLTGGQTALLLDEEESDDQQEESVDLTALKDVDGTLVKVKPSVVELESHQRFMDMLAKKSGKEIQWPN
jgi:DNA polymerase-3 subunit epsilon